MKIGCFALVEPFAPMARQFQAIREMGIRLVSEDEAGRLATQPDLARLELRDFDLDKMWRFRLHQDIKMPLLQHLVRWMQNEIGCELKSTRLLGQVGFH